MTARLHPRGAGRLFVCFFSVTFPFFLTHHLKAARQCESSFTVENLAKINFLLFFLALARQSKHDWFHSFCPRGLRLLPEVCTAFFSQFRTAWMFIGAFWWYVHALIARDVCGICSPRADSVIGRRRRMFMQSRFCVPYACAHSYTVCALKQKQAV